MWPFKRQTVDPRTLPSLIDEDGTWTIAQGSDAGGPLVVRANASARKWAGHPGLPIKLGLAIPLLRPDAEGLPDAEELAQLNTIEDIVNREVGLRTPGVFALVLTTGLMREFVLYVPKGTDFASIHDAIEAGVAAAGCAHEVQCMAVMEPRWTTFAEFAPG